MVKKTCAAHTRSSCIACLLPPVCKRTGLGGIAASWICFFSYGCCRIRQRRSPFPMASKCIEAGTMRSLGLFYLPLSTARANTTHAFLPAPYTLARKRSVYIVRSQTRAIQERWHTRNGRSRRSRAVPTRALSRAVSPASRPRLVTRSFSPRLWPAKQRSVVP